MALNPLSVQIVLDDVVCRDEGDGWGNAEPYLWTIFFKVDGHTASITPDLKLSGTALTHPTPGSHGNLLDKDVDAGDVVSIPAAIGQWETTLDPIPLPAPYSALTPSVSGVVGVICVLMEEDNVSDDGAEAGHAALNNAVQAQLNSIVNSRTFSSPDVTEADIDQVKNAAGQAVADAIKKQQNVFENVWSWLNPDDQIGATAFMFKHSDLQANTFQTFSERFKNEGDWEIRGRVMASTVCTIDLTSIVADLLGSKTDKERMRQFRDAEFRHRPALGAWVAMVARNNPQLAAVLAQDQELRQAAVDITRGAVDALDARDKPIPTRYFDAARKILDAIGKVKGRRARIDAARIRDLLPELEGKTPNEVIETLSGFTPGRHPRDLTDPSLFRRRLPPRTRNRPS
jgi:hypothetical protein